MWLLMPEAPKTGKWADGIGRGAGKRRGRQFREQALLVRAHLPVRAGQKKMRCPGGVRLGPLPSFNRYTALGLRWARAGSLASFRSRPDALPRHHLRDHLTREASKILKSEKNARAGACLHIPVCHVGPSWGFVSDRRRRRRRLISSNIADDHWEVLAISC
jgi:hypothetical protein